MRLSASRCAFTPELEHGDVLLVVVLCDCSKSVTCQDIDHGDVAGTLERTLYSRDELNDTNTQYAKQADGWTIGVKCKAVIM